MYPMVFFRKWACSKFGIWAYHLKELLLSFHKIHGQPEHYLKSHSSNFKCRGPSVHELSNLERPIKEPTSNITFPGHIIISHDSCPRHMTTHLLGHCSYVSESFPEDNKHFLGATTQSRGGTVEGSVSCTQHDTGSRQTGEGALARAHAWGGGSEFVLPYRGYTSRVSFAERPLV